MKQLGLQLFSVRDYMQDEKSIAESLKKLSAIGYTQAQTAGCAIDYKTFAKLLSENNIEVVGTHYSYDDMVIKFDETVENHQLLGTKNCGTGGMPLWASESVEGLRKFVDSCNLIGEKLSKYGMKFTYHNHAHEFIRIDGKKTVMDILVDELDPKTTSFCLDTYWVQAGGGDGAAWVEKLAGRIDILHLKDMKILDRKMTQRFCEILEGNTI